MGFTDNLKSVASNMQQGAKGVSLSFSQMALRLISGFFVGLVLTLIMQEFAHFGPLMFVFFTILFLAIIYRVLRPLSLLQLFIFDVICILIATSLRMYIMIAP